MKLQSNDGRRFELRVLGYESPGDHEEAPESDWLNIRIEVTHPRGSWSKNDPCLLTYELAELANWLEEAQHGTSVLHEIGFKDP